MTGETLGHAMSLQDIFDYLHTPLTDFMSDLSYLQSSYVNIS